MTLLYTIGDATMPFVRLSDRQRGETAIIAHINNDKSARGAGFVSALTKAYPTEYEEYAKLFDRVKPLLGDVFPINLPGTRILFNMVAQGTEPQEQYGKSCLVRYWAVSACLIKLRQFALGYAATNQVPVSVHMPRIGAGIGGGNWDEIEDRIRKQLTNHGIRVYVYDLPKIKAEPLGDLDKISDEEWMTDTFDAHK